MSCFCPPSVKNDISELQEAINIIPAVIPVVHEIQVEEARMEAIEQRIEPDSPPLAPIITLSPTRKGISLLFLKELAKSLPRAEQLSLRQLLDKIVLPATVTRRCAFIDTLPQDATGFATHYVGLDWEAPFVSTIESLFAHLKSASSPSFLIIDVLCFSLWNGIESSPPTTSEVAKSSGSSSGSSAKNGVTATPLMLDADEFVLMIIKSLSPEAHDGQKLTLLLLLNEHLICLGRMLPMHAAWRAMKRGVNIEIVTFSITSEHLYWPRQIERCPTTGNSFRLITADAPDSGIRSSLIKDMKSFVNGHSTPSPNQITRLFHSVEPASNSQVEDSIIVTLSAEGLSQKRQKWRRDKHAVDKSSVDYRMEMERRQLWHHLIQAATGHQSRTKTQLVVKAVFLSLDGRYSESKDVLYSLLRDEEQETSDEEKAHLFCLLAEVRLHLGQPLDAHNHALEALNLMNDCLRLSQPLVPAASSLPSFPTMVSSKSMASDGPDDFNRSMTAPNNNLQSSKPVYLSDNIQWGRTCLARSLELLNAPGQAEEIYRQMFIQLDTQEGPRAPRTLRMMSCLGRNLSLFQGRHEEGAILLRECLKSAKHAVHIWSPLQQILITRMARALRAFSSPSLPRTSDSYYTPRYQPRTPSNNVLADLSFGKPTLRMLHCKVSVLSCDIASAFSHMSREERREWNDGVQCHGPAGGAPMNCSLSIITSFRAVAAKEAVKKVAAGQKFLRQHSKSMDVSDLLVEASTTSTSLRGQQRLRNELLLSNVPNLSRDHASTMSVNDEVLLFDQACCFMEAACGVEHESSCLVRARAAAGAIASIPPVRNSQEIAEEANKDYFSSLIGHHGRHQSSPQASLPTASSAFQRRSFVSPEALEAIDAIRFEADSLAQCVGPHHAYAIDVRTVLAEVLESQLLYQAASEEWRAVVLGRKNQKSEICGSVLAAQALTQLAYCQTRLGNLQEAASTLIEAAQEFAAATGRLGLQTGIALFRAAEAQRVVGDFPGAEASLRESVEAFAIKYGRNNWRTKECRMALVESIEAQGRVEEAEQIMSEYRLKKSLYGREDNQSWRKL